MKLFLASGASLAIALAPVLGHESGHPHQHPHPEHTTPHGHDEVFRHHPHSHIMFHHVENACREDIQKFCETPKQVPQSTGDPFIDWIFLPGSPPRSEARDLNMMLDSLFDPLSLEPSRQITLFFVDESHEAPHFLVDFAAAKAADERQPEEIPQLAKDLNKYGNEMLTKFDGDSFQYKMARRLTEVDAKSIQHHVHLPFGGVKNHCLRRAADAGMVSNKCMSSMQELESTYALEEELEYRQNLFFGMMWVYIMTLSILLVVLARKMQSQRSKRQLRRRIIQAVYSNPDTKRRVEVDLGHSVGFVPPLNAYALRMIGSAGASSVSALRCMRRAHKSIFLVLLALVIFYPFAVLPLCIAISILRLVEVCTLSAKAADGDCKCCCCGASTQDVKKGNLTKAQECCNCCKGTGTCSDACASCCGGNGCCCGDSCCNGNCNCCDSAALKNDDCTCCCCGASVADAKFGNLTKDQECCNCCKGTGICSDACASCCGNGGCCCCGATEAEARAGLLTDAQACCCCCKGTGKCCCCSDSKGCPLKGRGQKHIVKAKKGVYYGVPIEVV
mmetsp:Transcript_23080/g.66264  ORF Transcript_23080/g.66264 Transcript_23080/m.66264 type:complete len:561 (-) Transcript_23080:104-1786(-)